MGNFRIKALHARTVAAVFVAAGLAGCLLGGDGSSTAALTSSVSGIAANSPLINVEMTLTCGDRTTTFTTHTGDRAHAGEYSFNVPATCRPPYLIEATGTGTMLPLDGSDPIPYDPRVNTPLRTISFDSTSNVNLTPVTTLVAQQALGSDGNIRPGISSDADIISYRRNLAASLGLGEGTDDQIRNAVNASETQNSAVARLSAVIAGAVQAAVAADPTRVPADIIAALETDIETEDISNAANITVPGINATDIQARADAIGRVVSAANPSGDVLRPSDLIGRVNELVSAATANLSDARNADMVRDIVTARIITQSEGAITGAITAIRDSTDGQAMQEARIRSVRDALETIRQQGRDAANAAIESGEVDIDTMVTQARNDAEDAAHTITVSSVCSVALGSAVRYVAGASGCTTEVLNTDGGGATVEAVSSVPAGITPLAYSALRMCGAFVWPPSTDPATLTPCRVNNNT